MPHGGDLEIVWSQVACIQPCNKPEDEQSNRNGQVKHKSFHKIMITEGLRFGNLPLNLYNPHVRCFYVSNC
jgi:hypothetical protein